jgi:hypothetical protein
LVPDPDPDLEVPRVPDSASGPALPRIKLLEDGLREACDWADCVSGESSMEQRTAISRLRKLADDDSTTPS